MKYVMGVDLGTSAVKIIVVDSVGSIKKQVSKSYPLIQLKSGYSEQDPEQWVDKVVEALQEIVADGEIKPEEIEGLSFSGQMHGLVMLDKDREVLRPAILWNDTRTTKQCRLIEDRLGKDLYLITKNSALEGFTLPKILWVMEHEPELFEKMDVFLLPKDYLRFRLTNEIHGEFSDASGTLLLDLHKKQWSKEICTCFGLDLSICPPLIDSTDYVGTITKEIAEVTGLHPSTKVFAGGADNACGALGAGVLSEGETLCSIGTSGVVLTATNQKEAFIEGNAHLFYHAKKDALYKMGVTLSAGQSLKWFRETFATNLSFDELLRLARKSPVGANGLLFTPYLYGERTPYADSKIRASFIGMDASHHLGDFVRAVMEGITFSLNESVEMFRKARQTINHIITIGGGAKSDIWLQIQSDIFNASIIQLENEQGPGMGAAMLAAYGCQWFESLEECAAVYVKKARTIKPIEENVTLYREIFKRYRGIYPAIKDV